MTTGTLEYGDISQQAAYYCEVEMLAHAAPTLVLQRFGLSKPQPKNKTDTQKFRRMVPLPAATTPLVEGVTPSGHKPEYEEVLATLKQYGDWIPITDKVVDVAFDQTLQSLSEACGEQAGRTMEQVTWGVLKGGTSVSYANGTLRTDVNTPITKTLQQKVTRYLQAQKAARITKILDPDVAYATHAVEAAYVAIGHTDLASDIRALPGFISVAEYGNRKTLCDEELGSVDDVRYILSADLLSLADAGGAKAGSGTTMVSTSGTLADIYPIIFLGKEAFGLIPLKGAGAITPSVVQPKPTQGDALGQRGSVGWKAWFVAKILNETWMCRAEVAATAL